MSFRRNHCLEYANRLKLMKSSGFPPVLEFDLQSRGNWVLRRRMRARNTSDFDLDW